MKNVQRQQVKALATTSTSWRKIAATLNIPKSTVSDYLRKNRRTAIAADVQAKLVEASHLTDRAAFLEQEAALLLNNW